MRLLVAPPAFFPARARGARGLARPLGSGASPAGPAADARFACFFLSQGRRARRWPSRVWPVTWGSPGWRLAPSAGLASRTSAPLPLGQRVFAYAVQGSPLTPLAQRGNAPPAERATMLWVPKDRRCSCSSPYLPSDLAARRPRRIGGTLSVASGSPTLDRGDASGPEPGGGLVRLGACSRAALCYAPGLNRPNYGLYARKKKIKKRESRLTSRSPCWRSPGLPELVRRARPLPAPLAERPRSEGCCALPRAAMLPLVFPLRPPHR